MSKISMIAQSFNGILFGAYVALDGISVSLCLFTSLWVLITFHLTNDLN